MKKNILNEYRVAKKQSAKKIQRLIYRFDGSDLVIDYLVSHRRQPDLFFLSTGQ